LCLELLAPGHRDDHVLRAEQQVVSCEDQAVGADHGAGAAAVGAQSNRGRDVRRWDMRVNANGGAENFFEQKYGCVHVDVPRIRLGPQTCRFKRDRSERVAKKKRRSLTRPPQLRKSKGLTSRSSPAHRASRFHWRESKASAAPRRDRARCTSDSNTTRRAA